MTSINREKLLDRLAKLFALAERNPNANEARAALMMAQRLMTENAINESDVRAQGEVNAVRDEIGKTIIVTDEDRVRKDTFAASLAYAIAGYFRVRMWNSKVSNGTASAHGIIFAGYGNDRKVAEMVFRFALKAMEDGAVKWISAWKVLHDEDPDATRGEKIARTRMERQSWLQGFIDGLKAGFDAALKENPQWIAHAKPPADVDRWVKNNVKLYGGKSYSQTNKGTGTANGHAAGSAFASAHSGSSRGGVRGFLK